MSSSTCVIIRVGSAVATGTDHHHRHSVRPLRVWLTHSGRVHLCTARTFHSMLIQLDSLIKIEQNERTEQTTSSVDDSLPE